ncbi:MAG: type IV pilus twitching motility protein PilT [Actinobacteria bacterium]|nr:type IV pilus twitching motility protein PilT [Actinomycetota bacterium]
MQQQKQVTIDELLVKTLEYGASDLHITTGLPPVIRLHGELRALDYPKLLPNDTRELIYSIMTQEQRDVLERNWEYDFSYSIPGKGRFRVNVYFQRGSVAAAFRTIPAKIPSIEDLRLPAVVQEFAMKPRGFVLVTGPTGSGKSTTLAAIINIINETRSCHIITIEDPIEFLHPHKKSVVNQREIGTDTHSFSNALKYALRQDPDVILIGEMRDLETIQTALTAAETGHLVFATLHTVDAPQTIDRIIDVFPPHQQQQVRVQLAGCLQGVISQQLLPTADGKGRVVACEVLVATAGIRNLIREGKTHQIYTAIQTGQKYGMQTLDMALADLVRRGWITYDTALEKCQDPQTLKQLIRGG